MNAKILFVLIAVCLVGSSEADWFRRFVRHAWKGVKHAALHTAVAYLGDEQGYDHDQYEKTLVSLLNDLSDQVGETDARMLVTDMARYVEATNSASKKDFNFDEALPHLDTDLSN